jgi:hypothetical protein
MSLKKFITLALTGPLLILILAVDLIAAVDVAPGQPLVDEMTVQALREAAALEISIEDKGDEIWNLLPGSLNTRDLTVTVKANTPWQLSIADTNPQTSGYMTEWTKKDYTIKRLSYPLKVKGSREVTLPNIQNLAIETGASTPHKKGLLLNLSLEQEVSFMDELLEKDNIYRIQLTFTMAPEQT